MKSSPSALSMPVLILVTLVFFAGCAGVSGSPSPNPTPAPAPHGTFVFVSGANSITDPIYGYRLNPDVTLTPIPGSPFPIHGSVAASGKFLLVTNGTTLTSYRVNPATGMPTQVGSAALAPFSDTIGADARNVYVVGDSGDIGTFIYGFSIADSGALTPVPGSPYISGGPCSECPMPLFPNLALNNNFLALSIVGFHGAGGIAVYPRDSNGGLGQGQGTGIQEQSGVALQPSGNVAFSLDFSMGAVNSYLLDPMGKAAPGMSLDTSTFGAADETVDATGKFLLVLDMAGSVNVFTIDSATAAFKHIGASDPAGDGANLMAMDPTGRFVIVAQASNQAIPAPPDQITVFTFDPATATMKKLQSYPVGELPFRIAFVSQ